MTQKHPKKYSIQHILQLPPSPPAAEDMPPSNQQPGPHPGEDYPMNLCKSPFSGYHQYLPPVIQESPERVLETDIKEQSESGTADNEERTFMSPLALSQTGSNVYISSHLRTGKESYFPPARAHQEDVAVDLTMPAKNLSVHDSREGRSCPDAGYPQDFAMFSSRKVSFIF